MYVVAEDVTLRGIDPAEFVPGVESVSVASLPGVFADYDAVWNW